MTIAALELNDQSLLIQAEDGAQYSEPGFARLTSDGIATGEEARAVAWREPQHVYDQYWCQLNQAPLPIRHRFARHHADIAFAQLRNLRVDADAAKYNRRFEWQVTAVIAHALANLCSELARGRQYQSPDAPPTAAGVIRAQPLQQR